MIIVSYSLVLVYLSYLLIIFSLQNKQNNIFIVQLEAKTDQNETHYRTFVYIN